MWQAPKNFNTAKPQICPREKEHGMLQSTVVQSAPCTQGFCPFSYMKWKGSSAVKKNTVKCKSYFEFVHSNGIHDLETEQIPMN